MIGFPSGVVSADKQVYLIEPLEGSVDGDHAVYRPEHLTKGREKRGAGVHQDVDVLYDNSPRPLGMRSRAPLKAQRFVELVVVVDSSEVRHPGTRQRLQTPRDQAKTSQGHPGTRQTDRQRVDRDQSKRADRDRHSEAEGGGVIGRVSGTGEEEPSQVNVTERYISMSLI